MDIFEQIVKNIIKEQERIIGPLAWDEARKVQGIKIVSQFTGEIAIDNGDERDVVNSLVSRYERLFGRASHEVCKQAVAQLILTMPRSSIPSSLI